MSPPGPKLLHSVQSNVSAAAGVAGTAIINRTARWPRLMCCPCQTNYIGTVHRRAKKPVLASAADRLNLREPCRRISAIPAEAKNVTQLGSGTLRDWLNIHG